MPVEGESAAGARQARHARSEERAQLRQHRLQDGVTAEAVLIPVDGLGFDQGVVDGACQETLSMVRLAIGAPTC